YTSEEEGNRAAAALKQKGVFEKGVYTWYKPDGTKVNQDAYEAVWEHVHERKLEYPKPRYDRPVFIRSERFDWVSLRECPGVESKPIGVFTERESSVTLYRLAAGARLDLAGPSLMFVLAGDGCTSDGEPLAKHTSCHLKDGEAGTLVAGNGLELVQLGLPKLPAQ
ncbi:MAG: hypothetical protein NTW37_04620, partial [Proteobacteria bacterium]|nr:hypothetical protein [Pseudomonadota bacterium]